MNKKNKLFQRFICFFVLKLLNKTLNYNFRLKIRNDTGFIKIIILIIQTMIKKNKNYKYGLIYFKKIF